MNTKIRVIGKLINEEPVVLGYVNDSEETSRLMQEYEEIYPETISFYLRRVEMLPYEMGIALNQLFKQLTNKPIWLI